MSTITNLAKANVKKDKTRSILIMISIVLTTLLLTAISGAGYGIIKIQQANAAEFYGEYYGRYMRTTKENIEEMTRHAEFSSIGLSARYAEVDNAKNLTLNWLDETVREMTHMESAFVEGHYPEEENEIAAAPEFFKLLGVTNPQIGNKVTIAFRTDLKSIYLPEEFVICGFLSKADVEMTNSITAYTSKLHYEKHVADAERIYTVLFRFDESIPITYDNAETMMKELAVSCGI
ncbi:MAG: hypothetical protein K2M91_06500, partial [Lachnospiraceae bacterium]|nr:hypothetical protein [Lachnospiraceae bacterium]